MSSDDKEIDGEYLDEPTTANALALVDASAIMVPLRPIMNLETAIARIRTFEKFVKDYLDYGTDYGRIPGATKDVLFKPGADKLCELYGLSDTYIEIRSVIDWERGLFDYELQCTLSRGSRVVTVGLGCCSSWESKYRYRDAGRKCPSCTKETIIKGKADLGGGWICWKRKGGCGKKFALDDPDIVSQPVGRIDNPDIRDLKNTILKMAKKRAKIDATLSATRSSGIFTQDFEEDDAEPEEAPRRASAKPAPRPQSQTQPQPDAMKSDDGYISEIDRREVFAHAGRAHVNKNDLDKYLLEEHGIDSTTKMTRAVADQAIAWLKMIERDQHPENESTS